MARKIAAQDPALDISFFLSGFYTYRSQLFAPFKPLGVQIISFHDPVLDGANMENSDLFEWTRRPGFSKFCPTQLGSTEIVNQFYSSRNLNGQVTAFFDSTVQLASFTSSGWTNILTKSTMQQGYVTTVGNMTYFSDGMAADFQKWGSPNGSQAAPQLSAWGLAAPTITPTIFNLGCWLPLTSFTVGNAIQDPNGCIEVVTATLGSHVTSGMTPTADTLALAGGVGTWTAAGGGFDSINLGLGVTGYTNYLAFTNFGFAIPTSATILGVLVTVQKWGLNGGDTCVIVDQSATLVHSGAPIGIDHADTTYNWNTGTEQPYMYGSATDVWGVPLTPAYINSSTFGIAIAANVVAGDPFFNSTPALGATVSVIPTITVYYTLASITNALSGVNEPIWSNTLTGVTSDGNLQWTNYGPIENWFPVTYFPTPAVVLDSNGNLQLATSANNPIASWSGVASYFQGDLVSFGGTYWVATAASTNIPPNANYSTSSVSSGITTTVSYWTPSAGPLLTGTAVPVWNLNVGGITTDGSYTWVNIGQGSFVETVGTSYVYGYRTIYGHLSTSSPISINTGSILGPHTASITGYAISGLGIVTFQGINNFVPGNTFTTVGLTTTLGATFNGQTFTVIEAASSPLTILSSTQFTAELLTTPPLGDFVDSGSTLNLIANVSGVGTASPLCNAVATITASAVSANIVTLTAANSFVPGLYITFTNLAYATFLNNQQLQIINVDPNGQWFQVYFVASNYATQTEATGTATFNAVEVYRVSDGGGIYLFAGAVTNPGGGVSWQYNDFTSDADLNVLQIAPQNDLNDPPPGAPGSSTFASLPGSNINPGGTITTYWQGRLWMAVGNYTYFDAGPDCTNGIPEESWPPANRFQWAGPVLAMKPTADNVGLLVYLADRVGIILGGPETISFYPADAFSNFGIANPNAIFRDSSVIGQFTTQKQYFELVEKNKTDIGEHIGDYLSANFSPTTTYATMHRDGLDVGMFLSNGVDRVLRYGTNINSWSVPAFPAGGAGALQSIETSVGVYSLMLASPTGGGYILARDLTTWQDGGTSGGNDGTNYTNCFVTIGSITLSAPGAPLFPLQHVVGYFDPAGTLNEGSPSRPFVWILPNEISGASGIGFVELPEVVQEPPTGQNSPSTTILALRWPVNMLNSSVASQFVHHLQLKVEWAPENAPNTIKAISFKELQD